MPSKLSGKWDLSKLIQITSQIAQTRFENMTRDVIKSAIRIKKVSVYDGKDPGSGHRTRYDVISSSYPQYYPYYTKYDNRGRQRSYQRTYKHSYLVTIQLDELSMSVPVKIRTGSDKKYVFNVSSTLIKSKKNPYGKYLSIGDYNIVENGINPDFFFTQSFVRWYEGCLFGRNYANGFPSKMNPMGLPFCTKHELFVIETMMNRGIFKLK